MQTLILVEHDGLAIKANIRQLITCASLLQLPITLLVVGFQCAAVAAQAAKLPNVQTVLWVDDEAYAHSLAENISALIVELATGYSYVLAAASTFGKNILPRVAALLDVVQISDVTQVIDHETFEHPIYAGNAIATVRVLDAIKVLTVRSSAFAACLGEQVPCAIDPLVKVYPAQSRLLSHQLSQSLRPDLSTAKAVVAGGRGLQNAENFQLIYQLADRLGAAVGASRAAVDAGFVSNDYQVGQTGKVVAPELYIAVGISGAVQHLAGMKDSKVIVAINKDPDAPIFQIATYGLVGDLFVILPEIMAKITPSDG